MQEITHRPALLPQGKFYYLVPYREDLLFAALDSDEMITASLVGKSNGLSETVPVPAGFAELLKIASYPIRISIKDKIEYVCGNNRGTFFRVSAPFVSLHYPEETEEIDGELLSLGIRLALSSVPLSNEGMFYITPDEIVATNRVILAVVQHKLGIKDTMFILPSHALSIPATIEKYSIVDKHVIFLGNGVMCDVPQVQGKTVNTSQFDAPPQFTLPRQDILAAVNMIKAIATEPYAVKVEMKERITLSSVYGDNWGQSQVDYIHAPETLTEKEDELCYSAYYLSLFFQALRGVEEVSCAIYNNNLIQVSAEVSGMRVRYVLPPLIFNR